MGIMRVQDTILNVHHFILRQTDRLPESLLDRVRALRLVYQGTLEVGTQALQEWRSRYEEIHFCMSFRCFFSP